MESLYHINKYCHDFFQRSRSQGQPWPLCYCLSRKFPLQSTTQGDQISNMFHQGCLIFYTSKLNVLHYMALVNHASMDGVTASQTDNMEDGHLLCKECHPIPTAPKLPNDGASKHISNKTSCL